MSQPAAGLAPPRDLAGLERDLVQLAIHGVIASAPEHADWLLRAGVAVEDQGALRAHPDWLSCALPCRDGAELLTRTALRDPAYRRHVDGMVAAVCAEIGRTGRWGRLEGLLSGPLAPLAPRLASLIATGMPADDPSQWVALDGHCWGHSGAAEALFPLVVARLPSLCDTPVFVNGDDALLGALVVAAATGEGIRVPASGRPALEGLERSGVPVWVRPTDGDQVEACLTLAVRAAASEAGAAPIAAPFSLGVSGLARRSAIVPTAAPAGATFWDAAERAAAATAHLDIAPGDRWPEEWTSSLPASADLLGLVGTRRSTGGGADEADEALRGLAAHPLYGLWLQVLLLEALDRELGEPTLFFAPDPAPVHAYYRPRRVARGGATTTMLRLGSVDEVLPHLASGLNIREVGLLGEGPGPWSRALDLLAEVDLVASTGERLAMTPHVLDRLHGGGLMTGVLRRGKDLRERLHGVLDGLWSQVGGAA